MVACSIPDAVIDQATLDMLQNGGVATIKLPASFEEIHSDAFQIASRALDVAAVVASASASAADAASDPSSSLSSEIPIISPNANSATVTGYHSAGSSNSLSRYNVHREGFIFSNGETFDIPLPTTSSLSGGDASFEQCMNSMFDSMCGVIAKDVLNGIARYLKIDEDWFENAYGPMDTSSQWHLKRYVEPKLHNRDNGVDTSNGDSTSTTNEGHGHDDLTLEEDLEWLPAHTDPSLISVIIHDAPGINANAMGLEYQVNVPMGKTKDENDGNEKKQVVWNEVEHHGHAIATIFCGSVMSYITGGLFHSAKHRVMRKPARSTSTRSGEMQVPVLGVQLRHRQAATLFLRPQGNSILTVPPSDLLTDRIVKIRRNCKFQDWLNRVSRNYQGMSAKQTKRNQGKKHKHKHKQDKQQGQDGAEFHCAAHSTNDNADPLYWADEYTELTLHGCVPELNGKEKFLGGELCELNNVIYTIPGFAHRILAMDVSVEPPKFELIGPVLPGEFKWLRGIPIGGIIYGIPCHSNAVLKIHALTKKVELLEWDENVPDSCPHDQKWKYHGAAVSNFDKCIYCIPQAAERVMKINPKTDEITFIGPKFPGVNKWYGGLILKDGCIYGICQNARGILRIDPRTQNCTVHGDFPLGHYKWHGAVKHTDGNLYCIPAHADQVLKVEPGDVEPKLSLLGKNIRTGAHRSDGKYKFLGGAVGGDCVYFFPSDADYVCEVNTKTEVVREVGPNLRHFETMYNNKWQNGFTSNDGSTIYGIPLKGQTVLRIRLDTESGEPDITTIGGPYTGLNKWEGGVSAPNGDMYCMPLNHKYSLRIRPLDANKRNEKEEIEDLVRYRFGNATLRSSSHTLRYSKSRPKDKGPNTGLFKLPNEIRERHITSYDTSTLDLGKEVLRMLRALDPEMIGTFRNEGMDICRLENLVVPTNALLPRKKTKAKDGRGEIAQRTLTDHVTNDKEFHEVFDRFVCETILPDFKKRLIRCGAIPSNDAATFYFQRPPTLRIQPGPSTRAVAAHTDATYGHQDGELNFWMPLTDVNLTKTDLWCESQPGREDFSPLGACLGEVVSFHGSSCKHYVPPNQSDYSRVSLDFRIGVEPYFDPNWTMPGTISDHSRKKVII